MIQIVFKNLEKSQLAKDITKERIDGLVDKFPELKKSKMRITLEMHNSPQQPGPDLFEVIMFVSGGKYDGVKVHRTSSNLYTALANLVDHSQDILNRYGDRNRVKERSKARRLALLQEI